MTKIDKWTEEEDTILMTHYSSLGAKGCREKGLNRTINAIKVRANSKGLKMSKETSLSNHRSFWTVKEQDILLKYFKEEGVKGVIKRGVLKSPSVICTKAIKLGLYK